jgi:hypothetical protein
MEPIEIVFQSLTLFIITISAFFVWLTLYRTGRWNRKKGAQEILDRLIVGEIPELNRKIKIDFGCKIFDHDIEYTTFIETLPDKQKLQFEDTLVRMLNIFEVVAINIKHKLIKEEICWEYAGWFYTEYYRFSKALILQRRKEAGDERVLDGFEFYATRWIKKMQNQNGSA